MPALPGVVVRIPVNKREALSSVPGPQNVVCVSAVISQHCDLEQTAQFPRVSVSHLHNGSEWASHFAELNPPKADN